MPAIGHRKLANLSRPDVLRLHAGMASTPYAANRVLALLSKMLNLAEAWGIRPDGSNPVRHVQKFKEAKRERFLSEAELSRLGEVLAAAVREKKVPPVAVAAVRLLLFTGCRLNEVLRLKWEDVDDVRKVVRLTDSKTGAREVLLSAPARAVLASLPRIEGNPYVLPGHKRGREFVELRHVWYKLRTAAGLGDVRLHDLRHSFGGVAAGAGNSLVMVGKLLGHSQAQTTQRYAHLSDDPLRAASDQTAAKIQRALNRRPRQKGKAKGGVVVPMIRPA